MTESLTVTFVESTVVVVPLTVRSPGMTTFPAAVRVIAVLPPEDLMSLPVTVRSPATETLPDVSRVSATVPLEA